MVGEIFLFNIQTQKERHSLNEKERNKQHTLRPTSNTVKGFRWLPVHCELDQNEK